MADRVDPAMKSVQTSGNRGSLDRAVRIAETEQLPNGDDAVLLFRQRRKSVMLLFAAPR